MTSFDGRALEIFSHQALKGASIVTYSETVDGGASTKEFVASAP